MGSSEITNDRVRVDGKFFRLGDQKFFVRGVTYGPFPPNSRDEWFPDRKTCQSDLRLIRQLGANVLRVYTLPPPWLFEAADQQGLKLFVEVPWQANVCFLESKAERRRIRQLARSLAEHCQGRSSVFAVSVVNEIPADIVRWSGHVAWMHFLDSLIQEVKTVDPALLCTFCNFPTTEYLQSAMSDFVAFNLYLHQANAFDKYLSRLQIIAGDRPLVLSETGIDTIREGLDRQEEVLSWQSRQAWRRGLAGMVVFSFTDEWYRGGQLVTDWAFGLTRKDRTLKPAFHALSQAYLDPSPACGLALPSVSVVVACYNGERTLDLCLTALERLRYPDVEWILVDDGSEDSTPQIARAHPRIRYFRHGTNLGLSEARNRGIAEAHGTIIAFTDADCRPDEDWLVHLVSTLVLGGFHGVGGPNLLPPDDSWVGAAVMVSPGGPAHVMLTDDEAEHVPGCNMAFYRSTLIESGGFDSIFTRAGDDVDICWRVRQLGNRIGFSPSGFVWHYRRATVRDYLKQQSGYGEAEALLVRKHPGYFNWIGGSLWKGRIYSPSKPDRIFSKSVIYRGLFAEAPFQRLYTSPSDDTALWFVSLEYQFLVNGSLILLSFVFPWARPLACVSLGLSLGFPILSAWRADLPPDKRRLGSRPLIFFLTFLQPLVRGWARYRGRFKRHDPLRIQREDLESESKKYEPAQTFNVQYWKQNGPSRNDLLRRFISDLRQKGWDVRLDGGWSDCDLEILGARWINMNLLTVAENHGHGKQLYRFRLQPKITLYAKVTFILLCFVGLLPSGFSPYFLQWIWVTMAMILIFLARVNREERQLRRWITLQIEETAKSFQLENVPP